MAYSYSLLLTYLQTLYLSQWAPLDDPPRYICFPPTSQQPQVVHISGCLVSSFQCYRRIPVL